jgi:ribosomal protein S27E
MPTDFECSECMLGFTIGTHHYHSNLNGYFGRTSLVCTECGCQHSIEIPYDETLTPITLSSMPELLIDCEKLRGTKLLFPQSDYTNTTTIDTRSTENLKCQNCGEIGSLCNVWESSAVPCPNCGNSSIHKLTDWMT